MSVYVQASASFGPGPGLHHGRSVSDQPIPSTLHNSPNSRPYINDDGPSTHPRPKQQRQNCFQISNPQTNQSLNAALSNNPPYPSPQVNQAFHAGPPNNPSYPSPQVNQVYDAGFPYHPNPQSPQAIPSHNTCTLFTNAIAVQAHSAGLYYNTTVLTRRKHWYFLIQITVPPPSIMSVRHDMTARQRARARLHQLTVNKRSLNEQRAFICGSSEKMEARLEVLEVNSIHKSPHMHTYLGFQNINQNPTDPNTKLSELYAVEAALEKADDDMSELARLWDQYEQEHEEIMTEVAIGEHGN